MSRLSNKSTIITPNIVQNIKYICSALFIIALTHSIVYAQSGKIIITCVFDGPLTGGKPKVIELFVREDISNLDDYGIERCANGNNCDATPDYTSMDGSASAGTYIYLAQEGSSDGSFLTFFGFNADYYSVGAANINGNDVVELQYTSDDGSSWTAIDIFGAEGTDGTGQSWEYLDSWAKSKPLRTTATTFSSSNWNYGSPNALDDESTNAAASTPFPIGGAPIKGDDGFRMMSSPVDGTVYNNILDPLWIQGMTNGDAAGGTANVWTYDASTPEWSALSNLNSASLTAGQGFLVFVYSDIDFDDDDDISSSKAIELYVTGQENQAPVTISTTASEWNLLGNPFRVTIDADQLFTDNSNYTSVVYVYDHTTNSATSPDAVEEWGVGIYRVWNNSGTGSLTNGLIAPYQGFWIQSGASGTSFDFTSSCKSSSARSEERRVGKECRSRWSPYH